MVVGGGVVVVVVVVCFVVCPCVLSVNHICAFSLPTLPSPPVKLETCKLETITFFNHFQSFFYKLC